MRTWRRSTGWMARSTSPRSSRARDDLRVIDGGCIRSRSASSPAVNGPVVVHGPESSQLADRDGRVGSFLPHQPRQSQQRAAQVYQRSSAVRIRGAIVGHTVSLPNDIIAKPLQNGPGVAFAHAAATDARRHSTGPAAPADAHPGSAPHRNGAVVRRLRWCCCRSGTGWARMIIGSGSGRASAGWLLGLVGSRSIANTAAKAAWPASVVSPA